MDIKDLKDALDAFNNNSIDLELLEDAYFEYVTPSRYDYNSEEIQVLGKIQNIMRDSIQR